VTARAKASSDKRRLILDAAVRVFARQGFHACRVSDIADEAGVAYGLVYHYFDSKDEVLDVLFLERWNVMLELIREVDAEPIPVREKLGAIVSFIVDSYRHDPDLMKVIIVEVTRAANSFGRTHIGPIRTSYELIGEIVTKAQAEGVFKAEIEPRFAAMAFYGAIEQLLTGWIFALLPQDEDYFERAMMENEMVKRLMWSGLLAALGALASIAANRAAGVVWRRIFDEEPPE
jgi:TetR/AcrR family transcriptional regulator, fatty acid metabolism regulator protein